MAVGPKCIEEVDFSNLLRSTCIFCKTFFFGRPNILEKYNLFLSPWRILGALFLCKSHQFFFCKYCIWNFYNHGQYKRENEYKRASKTSIRLGKNRLWKKTSIPLFLEQKSNHFTDVLGKSVLRKTKNGLWWTGKPFSPVSLLGILSIASPFSFDSFPRRQKML